MAFLENLEGIIGTLEEISHNDHVNGGEAHALLSGIRDFRTLFSLVLLRRVLSQCDVLSKHLQSPEINYSILKEQVKSTVEVISSFRENDFFEKMWVYCEALAEENSFHPPTLPRRGKIPQTLGGGCKSPYNSVKEFYAITVVFPLLDIFISEINSRFSENCLITLENLSNVLRGDRIDDVPVQQLCREYAIDSELLSAELKCFYKLDSIKNKTIGERVKICSESNFKSIFPLIFELYRLYLTIPLNSASSERAF